jgi:hypothetical protein
MSVRGAPLQIYIEIVLMRTRLKSSDARNGRDEAAVSPNAKITYANTRNFAPSKQIVEIETVKTKPSP